MKLVTNLFNSMSSVVDYLQGKEEKKEIKNETNQKQEELEKEMGE